MACKHENVLLTSSSYAAEAGFKPRSLKQIATGAGLTEAEAPLLPSAETYPGPLVLPGDELAYDPKWPEQPLEEAIECMNRLDRRKGGRHIIYVAAPPTISRSAPKGMKEWTKLRLPKEQRTNLLQTPQPRVEDVAGYIRAFYHGLPVKILQKPLTFTAWEDEGVAKHGKGKKSSAFPLAVGLQTSKEAIRIRCRQINKGPCVAQVNLNDLLDTAIAILPEDAYALLMLIEQDLYEEDDDDFCCGRAYGGSRIACVSMARYHPAADIEQDVDLDHAWPVAHCAEYVDRYLESCNLEPPKKKSKAKAAKSQVSPSSGPLRQAMNAYPTSLDAMTLEAYEGLWLGRFSRTASHELGHCFGMDHCLYYACAMQGTSSVSEDNRQPPYLCPVDLAKLLHLTGVTAREHHEALLEYCSKFSAQKGALFWTPFAEWLRGRLAHDS